MRRILVFLSAVALMLPATASALPTVTSDEVGLPLMKLTLVATVDTPIAMTARPGDDALYIVEQPGTVRALRDGVVSEPLYDIRGQVSRGLEQGLLGLAFSPDGEFMYVHYTDPQGHSHIVEYEFTEGRADMESAREILYVEQPFNNHNCGSLEFGPDGYLYICMGDGGSAGDPQGHGLNLGTLLGTLLRIDPRGALPAPYAIPADNPFVDVEGARAEIWAYGLRNPWKFSFDRDTDDLWIADVGQSMWEEINFQPADSPGGENYGWNAMEGTRPYQGGTEPENHTPPVYEYHHALGCSVTGGYVYRGEEIALAQGLYLFGDWCTSRVWALTEVAGAHVALETGLVVPALSAFGQDNSGELYAASLAGPVFKIEPLLG